MRKTTIALGLGLLSIIISPQALAGAIENFKVIGNSEEVSISWNPLSSDELKGSEGYALQWSLNQSEVRIDQPGRQFLNSNVLNLRRASFENGRYYYFRVYSYGIDDSSRSRILANGSKIIKWKISSLDEVTFEEIEANDPIVASTTVTDDDGNVAEFGELRVLAYDNFADISWSKPSLLAKSEYDGYQIIISNNSDLTQPVIDFQVDKSVYKARVKGLTPSQQYYGAGYFIKNSGGKQTFGKGATKSFKTIAAINRSVSTRASRNLARIENKTHFTVNVDGSNTSSTSNTLPPATSAPAKSSSAVTNNASEQTIRNRIKELQAQIKKLETDLSAWQKKLRDITGRSAPTSTTSRTKSSKKLSLRERLKLRFNR